MTERRAYTYAVLRYVHDVVTGEFVNVGVVLHVPSLDLLRCRVRNTMGRLRGVFPDLHQQAFLSALRAVDRSVGQVERGIGKEGLLRTGGDALSLARKALPADDSSLQWSPILGSGTTEDPTRTLDRLYERLVGRYDARSRHRRTDDDVWRPVRHRLEAKRLTAALQETVISGALDDVVFKHAWKNGHWHCYEPVSFDLADADGIKGKAREWLGHLAAVTADGAAEPIKLRFVVGAPSRPELHRAYEAALAILRRAAFSPEVFEETQMDAFVASIEDDMRARTGDELEDALPAE